jgi:hypothetical protein
MVIFFSIRERQGILVGEPGFWLLPVTAVYLKPIESSKRFCHDQNSLKNRTPINAGLW